MTVTANDDPESQTASVAPHVVHAGFLLQQANLDAGSEIGSTVLDATLTLDIGAGSEVVIEKQVSFDLESDAESTLVFDINSEAWVTEDNADAGTVASSEIESATSVAVQ